MLFGLYSMKGFVCRASELQRARSGHGVLENTFLNAFDICVCIPQPFRRKKITSPGRTTPGACDQRPIEADA
jgi:hypothetical protein